MNIKDKLREIDRHNISARKPAGKITSVDLNKLLDGAEHHGCFLVESSHDITKNYGTVQFDSMLALSSTAFSIVGKDERLAQLNPQHTVFIDTETTGLAGGTGTFAFLVGIGYFEGNEFIIRQYFMRQPGEEHALVTALMSHFKNCLGLVTFNGKSYDIPLLESRFLLNRERFTFSKLPHLDILHAARRLWKDYLQDCSLMNLENKILKLNRTEDIPGALIPEIYFDFVRTGNTHKLKEIFAHNRQDILTMTALLVHMGQLVHAPFQQQASISELRKIGKLYRDTGDLTASTKLFEKLTERHQQQNSLEDYLSLGFCYKSQKRYQEAAQVWQIIINKFSFHPLPYIELAKDIEHRVRDYEAALSIVQRALRSITMLEELQGEEYMAFYHEDLLQRDSRLKRKNTQKEQK